MYKKICVLKIFIYICIKQSQVMAQNKKPTRAEKMKAPLSSDLKMRVLEAKKELPVHGLTALFFHYFKDFKDTVKNKSKLNNVLQTRATDEDITLKLEELVELLKNK